MVKLKKSERILVSLLLLASLAFLFMPSDVFLRIFKIFGGHKTCPLGFGDGGFNPHNSKSSSLSTSSPLLITVYTNCTVYTGPADQPPAQAFAVQASKFLNVGSVKSVLDAVGSLSHSIVDLGGAFVTPGLIDAHLHLISGGQSLTRLNLRGISSKQKFIEAVAEAVKKAQPGEWVLGSAWDESKWGGEEPTSAWIDAISPKNPVFLTRMDAHQGLANTLALKLANISKDTADPDGGVIARNGATGEPTGLLSDAAMLLLSQSIPPPLVQQREEALDAAQRHLLSLGVTAVHDMGRIAFLEGEEAAWEDLEEIYLPAANAGNLKLRVKSFVPLPTWRRMAERVRHVGTKHPKGRLSWGAVKEFYDGSLGSRTALMHEPYADVPASGTGSSNTVDSAAKAVHVVGTRTVDAEVFTAQIAGADAAGLQIAVHAIGDRAVDEVLAAYAALKSDKTHRIEHAQHISGAAAAQKLSELGIGVTPNPLHLVADKDILESRLGAARVEQAYAFKTLCNGGHNMSATCAFSSDWPVVPLDPLGTLKAAAMQGRVESVSLAAALEAQTVGAAKIGGREREIGKIAPGLRADFVIFDSDILDILDIGRVDQKVLSTYIDGFCEYGCRELEERSGGSDVGDIMREEL